MSKVRSARGGEQIDWSAIGRLPAVGAGIAKN
jgi:hypothetical protein